MDRRSAVYGFKSDDMEAISLALEAALGVRFEQRESLSWGGPYALYENDDAVISLRLRFNRDLLWRQGDDPEEMFAVPTFSDMALLLDVEHPEPASLKHTLLSRVPGATHLK